MSAPDPVAAGEPALGPAAMDELGAQRWFAGRGRSLLEARPRDWLLLPSDGGEVSLVLVDVRYADGAEETYVLVRCGEGLDALNESHVAGALVRACADSTYRRGAGGGAFTFVREHGAEAALAEAAGQQSRPLGVEQSNSSVRFGDTALLKVYRRARAGPQPDLEVPRFLTRHSTFRNAPPVLGSLEYRDTSGADWVLGLVQRWVPNRGDAWGATLARLEAAFGGADPADSLAAVRRLGTVTADLHVALAPTDASADPAFAPEPIGAADVAAWRAAIEAEVQRAVQAVAALQPDARLDTEALLARARGVEALAGSQKIRHHGDYHLGQVLERADGDVVVIDFEGEPARPLDERREKRSPLRDVAGMLRSLDYARHAALRTGAAHDPRRVGRAAAWHGAARAALLEGYLARVRAARPALLPADPAAVARALDALEVEKAAYEAVYEVRHRPDWLEIPLAALVRNDPA